MEPSRGKFPRSWAADLLYERMVNLSKKAGRRGQQSGLGTASATKKYRDANPLGSFIPDQDPG